MAKRCIFALMAMVLATALVGAQDTALLVESYRRNFARASLATKYDLLKEAAQYDNMGPLYESAVQFVLDNAPLLQTDILLRDIAVLSVNMTRQYKHVSAAPALLNLFKVYRDNTIRVPVLHALAELAHGEPLILRELNSFLDTQNSLFQSGVQADLQVIEALVQAIGQLGDATSFPVLFTTYTTNYSRAISDKAIRAMASLDADFGRYLAEVIQQQPAAAKLAALRVGLTGDILGPEQRGELAEAALLVGVNTQASTTVDQSSLNELSAAAARELTALEWQKASPLAIRHFYNFQTRFNRNQLAKGSFLEAIALLGAMGTAEAAQALSLYLQLINTETEQGKSYDEQITLAVINNLGRLGDKTAFDYLLYVGYLQYPENVKRAARDAMQKLLW